MYLILADAIVVLHLAYILFVVVGQLLIIIGAVLGWGWVRNPWFRIIHFIMIVIVAVEAIVNFECPLTTWEDQLRQLAGQETGSGETFIGRLLGQVVFKHADVPLEEHWALKAAYYGIAAIVGLTLLLAPPRWKRASLPAQDAPTTTTTEP